MEITLRHLYYTLRVRLFPMFNMLHCTPSREVFSVLANGQSLFFLSVNGFPDRCFFNPPQIPDFSLYMRFKINSCLLRINYLDFRRFTDIPEGARRGDVLEWTGASWGPPAPLWSLQCPSVTYLVDSCEMIILL